MLASWYPSRLSPFNGDFIKRHAEAVSIYEDVHVIYVVRDVKGEFTKDSLIEESVKEKLKETIIYYYVSHKIFPIIDKLFSGKKYRFLFKQAVNRCLEQKDKPELVHVHVGMKSGIIAYWLKKSKNIPYVITEHWSGFLGEANDRFNNLPFYLKSKWKKIIDNAIGVSAVSEYLSIALRKHFVMASCKIIPNVVDTNIFCLRDDTKNTSPRFIHISGLEALKNPDIILKAFQMVVENYPDAFLEIFGSQKKEIVKLSEALHLQNNVSFYQEVSQTVLAEHMNLADALILYSSYETFGCVIIEANACGVPVIVSDIPVFHETVHEGENGYFVKANDPVALAEKMMSLIKNHSSFNREKIVSMTRIKYSYEIVGKQFSNWYNEILES